MEGVLTPAPDMMAEYYGEPNTTYADLRDSLRTALASSAVREIVWSIDSPGGSVDGLFALLDEIEGAREASIKPMRVEATNAHSAAYGIAAAVGNITATSRMASFGSVGVATSGFIQGGICGTVVDMTNTDSPEKRPNLATDEGRAVVVKYLDQLAAEFTGTIARGRGVTPDAVREGYGRGSSMLARAAKEAGLIDVIDDPRSDVRTDLTDAPTQGTVAGSMPTEASAPAQVETPDPAPAPVPNIPAAPVPQAAAPAAPTTYVVDAEEYAELQAFRATKVAAAAADRRALITELVALGAETPATAWVNDAAAPRLASEPLDSLCARVEALRAAKPVAAAIRPPAADGAEALTDFERRDADKIKDPEARARFVAGRIARKQKAK